MEIQIFKKLLKGLQSFTKECRDDMHEPDEQNIKARIVGYKLDNAFGEYIGEDHIEQGFQEYVVILENDKREIFKINLASLIALARLAKVD